MSRPISSITLEDVVGFQTKVNRQLLDFNGRLGSLVFQLNGLVPQETVIPDPATGVEAAFLPRMFVENSTTQNMLESIQLKLVELENIMLSKPGQPERAIRPFMGKVMPAIKDESDVLGDILKEDLSAVLHKDQF